MPYPAEGLDLFYMLIYGGFGYSPNGSGTGAATGLAQAGNPPYAISDFCAFYPQFGTVDGNGNFTGLLPQAVLQAYINLANASLMSSRWRETWPIAMALYVAHFATLYLRVGATAIAQQVISEIHGEVPQGAVPGSVYTISAAPPGGSLGGLYLNGEMQIPGVDYTLAGMTITLTNPTGANDKLYSTWPLTNVVIAQGASSAQVAAAGLTKGVLISKSVDGASAGYQIPSGLEDWASWTTTEYGMQLATFAQSLGAGMIYIR